MRGAIWYQGESNRLRPVQYSKLFPTMIKNWRDNWQQGDFPFYYVQIAPFNYRNLYKDEDEYFCAELQEAQLKSLTVPNVGMVVTMDIGDLNDIHPKNKQAVGKRLSLWALAKTYGKKGIIYSGPLYKSMKIEGNKIRVVFDYAQSGLVVKGESLKWFTISGQDKKFVPANAIIDGNDVVVWSGDVKNPTAVRFGWSMIAQPNLFNKEGLPASPFRTDN
jgi:sialate O-acetylesterase